MSGSNHYEMILKKGTLRIELSSDDDYFMSKQLDRWFKALLAAPPGHPQPAPEEKPLPTFRPPEQATPPEPVIAEAPPEPPPAPVEEEPEPEPMPEPPEPMVVERVVISAFDTAPAPPKPKPAETFIDAEISPLQDEIEEPELEEDEILDDEVKDDFEAVMASIKEDMDKPDDQPEPDLPKFTVASPLTSVPESKKQLDLDMVESLTDLYERSNASSAEDILLLSAFYLTYCEKEEKFSLRRINSMIVRSGLNPVTHSVIEGALAKGYLEMVPDMTGMAEVTEYRLTDSGVDSGKATTERLF